MSILHPNAPDQWTPAPIPEIHRAPTHKPFMSVRDVAARLRAGETLAALAVEHGRSIQTLTGRLSRGGWGADGHPVRAAHARIDVTVPLPPIENGACRDADPDLFFPGAGGHAGEALAICRDCPAKAECLAWALELGERGIWGGTSDSDRRRMLRQGAAS